jgi:hypothetical protein
MAVVDSTQMRAQSSVNASRRMRSAESASRPQAVLLTTRCTACVNGATHLHMHNPKPLPPSSSSLVVVRPKVWNSLSLNSAGMPIPVSATLTDIMSLESCSTLTVIDPS